MNKLLLCSFVLTLPLIGSAALVTVTCDGISGHVVQADGTATCSGAQDTLPGGGVTTGSTAIASLSTFSVFADAGTGGGSAYAEIAGEAQVLITGGTGNGVYMPCIATGEMLFGTAVGHFGTVSALDDGNSCVWESAGGGTPIPFTYGVPQLQPYDFFVQVSLLHTSWGDQQGSVSMWNPGGGIALVFPVGGSPITGDAVYGMNVSIIPVEELTPEPATLPLLFCALGIGLLTLKRHL